MNLGGIKGSAAALWMKFLWPQQQVQLLNLNQLIDQSIKHFGTLPHFVRHYGIRHSGSGTNPFQGRKSLQILQFVKVFSAKFGDVAPFGMAQVSNPRKFSPRKLYFTNSREFSPLKVFCYMVHLTNLLWQWMESANALHFWHSSWQSINQSFNVTCKNATNLNLWDNVAMVYKKGI